MWQPASQLSQSLAKVLTYLDKLILIQIIVLFNFFIFIILWGLNFSLHRDPVLEHRPVRSVRDLGCHYVAISGHGVVQAQILWRLPVDQWKDRMTCLITLQYLLSFQHQPPTLLQQFSLSHNVHQSLPELCSVIYLVLLRLWQRWGWHLQKKLAFWLLHSPQWCLLPYQNDYAMLQCLVKNEIEMGEKLFKCMCLH